MLDLIRADFLRVRKGKAFYVCLVIMGFMGFTSVPGSHDEPLETGLLSFLPIIAITAAVFDSLLLGSDYADGTIRNKISTGNRRISIYLSNLIICFASNLILCAAYDALYLIAGSGSGGSFLTETPKILLFVLCSIALTAVWTALFVIISMLCTSKAYSAAACILTAVILIVIGISTDSELYSMNTEYEMSVEMSEIQGTPKPEKSSKHKMYEFLNDFNPGGQMMDLTGMSSKHPPLLIAYDAAILIVSTAFGIAVFNKKSLK